MIQLQLNDVVYEGFTYARIEKDIENLCGTLEFGATTLQGGFFPINRGDKCVALVDGIKVLTGYVDQINVENDKSQHSIKIHARDKTQDIADSKIDATIELKAPITIENVIKALLKYLGANDIKVTSAVSDLESFAANEMVSGQVGQGAFDFLSNFLAKRQVLLTTNGDGNLLITRGVGIDINATIISQIGGLTNNILKSSVTYDDTKRFHTYIIRSQANLAALTVANQVMTNSDIVGTNGQSIDDTVRASRVFVINADKTTNLSDAVDRAQWERDIHNARAINYTATLQGHQYFGVGNNIWQPLQIIRVIDDFCNVNDKLIVRKVTWGLDLQLGNYTDLDLVPKDTFVLLSEQARKRRKKRKGRGGSSDNSLPVEFSTND